MLAIAFDTLKLARKLESAGFPAKQAQDASAALAESITEWHSVGNLATKEDISALRADVQKLDTRISETKAEILKWMFGSIAVQTFVLLGALIGLIHGEGRL